MAVGALALEQGQIVICIAAGKMNEMDQPAKRRGNPGIFGMASNARLRNAAGAVGNRMFPLEAKAAAERISRVQEKTDG